MPRLPNGAAERAIHHEGAFRPPPMKPASESLVFTASATTLALSVALVVLTSALALLAWRRSGWRPLIGWLELLRVLIAAAIAVTLNQPEWRQVFKPESKPTLTILVDASRSMETRDVLDPAQPAADPRSRAEAAKPLTDPAAWKSIAARMDVAIEPFNSSEQPAEEGTDLNAALVRAAEKHPHLGATVLLSDGDWNSGEPPAQAAMRLRMRGVPVFAVPLGAESRLPDVELASFDVPTFAIAGKPLRIPFTIESSLPRDESVTLEMKTSTGEVVTKPVVIPAMSRLQDVIIWHPDKPGDARLTLTVPKTGDERFLENNSIEAPLSIRKEQLRVLVIESFPRWEYRYLRNALERDPGVVVNCLLFQPDLGKPGVGRGYLAAFPKDEELAKYDVIFLGDVGIGNGQLTPEQCTAIQKLVRDQAAGLVFLPGLRGNEGSLSGSTLGELSPVVWDEAQPRGFGTSAPRPIRRAGRFRRLSGSSHRYRLPDRRPALRPGPFVRRCELRSGLLGVEHLQVVRGGPQRLGARQEEVAANPSLTVTISPMPPREVTRSRRTTFIGLSSLHDVGEQGQEAGALDGLGQFALLDLAHRGDARGHDLAALADVTLQELHILVVDLRRAIARERADLAAAEEGAAPAAPGDGRARRVGGCFVDVGHGLRPYSAEAACGANSSRGGRSPRSGTIAALTALTVPAGQDGGKLQVDLVDLHGHEAQDVFVERELALHLLDGGGRRVERQKRIVPLAVLLDAIGQVAQAPIFDLGTCPPPSSIRALRVSLRASACCGEISCRAISTCSYSAMWRSVSSSVCTEGRRGDADGRSRFTTTAPRTAGLRVETPAVAML